MAQMTRLLVVHFAAGQPPGFLFVGRPADGADIAGRG